VLIIPTSRVDALDVFDGRVEVHGFFESQLRVLSDDLKEEYDLAQWYQVFNLEVEVDVLPDGWGPIDLLQAYVRLEARYDCVYSNGCGMFSGADTYGNDAKRLPTRLSSARSSTYHGAIRLRQTKSRVNTFEDSDGDGIADQTFQRIEVSSPGSPIVNHHNVVPLEDIPGFSGLANQTGADGYFGQPAFGNALNGWAIPAAPRPDNFGETTFVMNPVPIDPTTPPNPFLSETTVYGVDFGPGHPSTDPGGDWALKEDDPFPFVFERFLDFKFAHRGLRGGAGGGRPNAVMGPWLPKNFIYANAALADIPNPFDGAQTPDLVRNAAYNGSIYSGSPWGWGFNASEIDPDDPTTWVERFIVEEATNGFNDPFQDVIRAAEITGGFLEVSSTPGYTTRDENATFSRGSFNNRTIYASAAINSPARVTAAKPLRPVPIVDAGRFAQGDTVARGVYMPSRNLRSAIRAGRVDTIPLNFTESERAWNRGASQQDEGELKEAYIDLETLDSRLWLRLGKQNIVWGKTELFRTTDQFNPVDLALATLGNLEETRIALWSARAVLSLYEIGPFEDVRIELAANLDDYESNDFGACGEPFTPNPVCDAAFGMFAHGTFGIGLAGVEKPESPWDDPSKIEFGGRIEWRWDRFSFAIADFYGYEDLPFLSRISTYSRNVDPNTGRMRVMDGDGHCRYQPIALREQAALGVPLVDDDCLQAGTTRRGDRDPLFPTPVLFDTTFQSDPNDPKIQARIFTDADMDGLDDTTGLVFNPFENFDPVLQALGHYATANPKTETYSVQNALDAHPTNQQFFAAICAGTIGVSSLDPAACVGSIFGSQLPVPIASGLVTTAHVIGGMLAGSRPDTSDVNGAAAALVGSTELGQDIIALATIQLNHDSGDAEFGGLGAISPPPASTFYPGTWFFPSSVAYDTPENSGCVDNTSFTIGGSWGNSRDGLFTRNRGYPCHSAGAASSAVKIETLPQTLSVQQQALLGCGPFFGTNCSDSGIDLLNAEASALFQSFPGFEGTGNPDGGSNWTEGTPGATRPRQWTTNNFKHDGTVQGRPLEADGQARQQPGTIFFKGGPVATVYARLPGESLSTPKANHVLPGARSPFSYDADGDLIPGVLNPDYDPFVDGCLGDNAMAAGGLAPHAGCAGSGVTGVTKGAREYSDLEHPGIRHGNGGGSDDTLAAGAPMQYFKTEMAGLSWNLLATLAMVDTLFDDDNPWGLCEEDPANPGFCLLNSSGETTDICSLATPQHCGTVRGLFGLAGVTRNTMRAGGDGTFGRRTFIWQSGGEALLSFERRNVLGFSMDFAEDVTKSNFSVEATWIPGVRRGSPNSMNNVRRGDDYNLTISVDRPTFINFLNANRTFFFNAQFFMRYRAMGSESTMDLLSTFSILAGYFQDRLLPTVTFVHDARSNTFAVLPTIQYRYNEAFSIIMGMQFFSGHPKTSPISVNGLGPASNQQGPYAYRSQVDHGVSIVRQMDSIFLRLRYAF